MNKIQQKLKALQEEETKLLKQLDKQRANKTFVCVCRKRHKIKDCEIRQGYYWVPPSGCTDGAYFAPGELYIPCPDTNVYNRVYFPKQNKTPWEQRNNYNYNIKGQFDNLYRKLFKKYSDIDRDEKYQWTNNTYFDVNYKFFDLQFGEEEETPVRCNG